MQGGAFPPPLPTSRLPEWPILRGQDITGGETTEKKVEVHLLNCPLPGSCLLMPMLTTTAKPKNEVSFLMSKKRGMSLQNNLGRRKRPGEEKAPKHNKTKPFDGIPCNSLSFCPSICQVEEGVSSTNSLISQTEELFEKEAPPLSLHSTQ